MENREKDGAGAEKEDGTASWIDECTFAAGAQPALSGDAAGSADSGPDSGKTGEPALPPAPDEEKKYKQRLSMGSILVRTVSTLFNNPLFFFGIVALVSVPMGITLNVFDTPAIFDTAEPFDPTDVSAHVMRWVAEVGSSIVTRALTLVAEGAIVFAVFRILRGDRPSFGRSITRGLSRLFPLIICATISGIGIAIGMKLLLIPGIMAYCIWAVAVPACVVEGLGPMESLGRSCDLTEGYRWPIFGVVLIMMLLTMLVTFGVFYAAGTARSAAATGLLVGVLTAVTEAFSAIMLTIIYSDLRKIKDGVSLDELVNAVD